MIMIVGGGGVTDPDGMWVNLIYIIFYSFIYI